MNDRTRATLAAEQGAAMTSATEPVLLLTCPECGSAVNSTGRAAHDRWHEAFAQPGPSAAEFLAAIDPATLQARTLARPDLGTGPNDLVRGMLNQLTDWALGKE